MIKALLILLFVSLGYLLNAQTHEIIGNGNLRSGPGTNYEIIGKVTTGAKVTQIDFSKDWYKVELDDNSMGWIHKSLAKSETQGKKTVQQIEVGSAHNNLSKNVETNKILETTDAINVISTNLLKLISETSFYVLELQNNFKKINISDEYPLCVNLSHVPDGKLKIYGDSTQMKILGNVNLDWILTFGIIGEVKTSFGVLSGIESTVGARSKDMATGEDFFDFIRKQSSMNDYSKNEAFIKKGKINIEGEYFTNGISIFFETGYINFLTLGALGEYSEGTILNSNGVKYIYSNHTWIKQ